MSVRAVASAAVVAKMPLPVACTCVRHGCGGACERWSLGAKAHQGSAPTGAQGGSSSAWAAEEAICACVRRLAGGRARGEIRARARPLGASAEGAWGPAAEDVICGSVRSSGAKMRALAQRDAGAWRAGVHASASRTGKSGRGACLGAKESGVAL
jgi:hypothetical protein